MERSAKKTFQQWSIWKEISKRAPDDSVKREYEVQRYLYREAIESVAEGLLQAKDDKDPSNQRFHRGSAWTRLADYFLSGFETLRIADKYYRKGGTIELTLNELKSFQKLLKEERILPQETSGAPSSGQDDKLWGYKLAHRLYLRALSPSHELHPDLFQEEMALRFDHSSNNFAWSGLFMEQDSGVLAILDVSRKAIRKRFFAPRDFKEKEDRPELYDTLAEVYSRTGDQKKAYDLTDESLLLLKSEIEKLKKLKDRFDQVHTPYATLNSEAVARRLERLERRRGYYLCQINRFQGMIKKEPSQEASNIKGQIRK